MDISVITTALGAVVTGIGSYTTYLHQKTNTLQKDLIEEKNKCQEDKKELEQRIEQLEIKVLTNNLDLFSNTLVPTWIADENGNIIAVNDAFISKIAFRFKLRKLDIINKKMKNLFVDMSNTLEELDNLLVKGETVVEKINVKIKEDDLMTFNITQELFKMNNDEIGIVGRLSPVKTFN